MQAFLRVYAFLCQIFDYGNTAVEKRAIFFRYLVRLLEFGREREELDLSQVVLTHHKVAPKGTQRLSSGGDENKLKPATELGSGQARDPEKVRLAEIIEQVNDLFEGELTDDDKLVYVNEVLRKKLMESDVLAKQAQNNSKEQFAASPNLSEELMNAIMDSFAAHSSMSKQALDSEAVRDRIKEILLGPGRLWEDLRQTQDQT